MKTQKNFFEQNGGTYTCVGDVLLPKLVIGEVENCIRICWRLMRPARSEWSFSPSR